MVEPFVVCVEGGAVRMALVGWAALVRPSGTSGQGNTKREWTKQH